MPSIDITMWQIIYGLFTISHPKTLYPLLQFRNRRSAIQQFSLFNNRTVRNTAFQIVNGFSESASSGSCKQNNGLAGKIIAFQKGVDNGRRDIPPDGVLKCSPSSPALENTGLNGLHKCVFCSFLVAYCSDLSYLHCTLAHLFIQIPMFNCLPYVLWMARDSGCLIRCLYVFSYILLFTSFGIHSGFSCW